MRVAEAKRVGSNSLLGDPWLIVLLFGLVSFGLVMVSCASIAIAERHTGIWFYYLERQLIFACVGSFLCWGMSKIPLLFWEKQARLLLLLSFIALIAVLIPGVGRTVNGSTRWIVVGGFGIQVSEFVKIATLIYLASYIVRFHDALKKTIEAFVRPLFMLALLAVLLLMEPDFGSIVVIFLTGTMLLFLAGVPFRRYAVLIALIASVLIGLAVISPYRWQRITSFLNPWDDQFSSGYQLTQALIAFGRGEWVGEGLGRGVQKLFYLPEAHTDFIFAVVGEELGLLGALLVLSVYIILVSRGFWLANQAIQVQRFFAAYLAYGISLFFGMQAIISIGVNVGMLPTKGLTLPFISYGGSSLLACMVAMGLLCRVSNEVTRGATRRRNDNSERDF